MKKTILTLTFLLCAFILKAQLFREVSLYPNTTGIHGKYFNGTGGRGYWTYEKVDAFGRIVERNSYKNKELLAKYLYQYNDKHDVTRYIYITNDLPRIDTTTYEYTYINNRIAFQKCTFSNNINSITYRLVANQGDSVLTYQELSYHYYPAKKTDTVFERTHILTYQDHLLVKKEEIISDKEKVITCFEYYNNGKLKRRIITREPKPEFESVYVGGPGSDDQSYRYTYDRAGRVKQQFTIVADKTYKQATYRYEN